MNNEYYYNQMSKLHQRVYRQIYDGMVSLASGFSVTALSMKELSDIWFRLRLDHPDIFYVVSFSCRGIPGADSVEFRPEYMFEKKKIQEHRKNLEARIQRLLRTMEKGTPEDKLLGIHDFLVTQVTYDKLKKGYSHEIIGPLQQGIGVCEGIAKTVKLFCDRMNIPCLIAICDAAPEQGNPYRHAWNLCQLNHTWYHVDATFDNSITKSGSPRYDYFLLGDKQIFRDHRKVMYPVPACPDSDFYYYKTRKLSFTKEEEVEKRIEQTLRKKKTEYVFHWRGGYLTRKVFQDLAGRIGNACEKKEQFAILSVNFPQAVISVTFTEKPGEAAVIPAELPEGEGNLEPAEEAEESTPEI